MTKKISDVILKSIIDGTPVPTFVIDMNHVVTHWNRACEVITGTLAKDVIGTTDSWKTFYPEEERMLMADLIVEVVLDEQVDYLYKGKYSKSEILPDTWEAKDFFPHFPDGGKWLAFSASPLHDEFGNIIGAIETLRDITAQKKYEQKNAEMLEIQKRNADERKTELDAVGMHVDYFIIPALKKIEELAGTSLTTTELCNGACSVTPVGKLITSMIGGLCCDLDDLKNTLKAVR